MANATPHPAPPVVPADLDTALGNYVFVREAAAVAEQAALTAQEGARNRNAA